MDPYAHCAATLRQRDRDRYVADLFAPQSPRRHLFALHAFASEVARVRDMVSEPGLGEIRLQWWRDALTAGPQAGHPIATALNQTIADCAMPYAAFAMLIDAREFDLYDDPMPTFDDLEGYAGQTTSSLLHLSAAVLAGERDPGSTEAAGHAGVALTLTAVMRALPLHAARGQCYLPQDLMVAHGLEHTALLAGATTPALTATLAELRSIAREHLAAAERAIASLDPATRPAFLPLTLVGPDLDLMDRPTYQPLSAGQAVAPWRRMWLLWRAARRA